METVYDVCADYAHQFGKRLSHLKHVCADFWSLQGNGDVCIAHPVAFLANQFHSAGEQYSGVNARKFVGTVREVMPDIPQCQCAQKGVAERVYGHVSVGMGNKAASARFNVHSSQVHVNAFAQAVYIITLTYPDIHILGMCFC